MGKKRKSKTRKRAAIRDLTPKNTKQMKGGVTSQDLHLSRTADKSSPTL